MTTSAPRGARHRLASPTQTATPTVPAGPRQSEFGDGGAQASEVDEALVEVALRLDAAALVLSNALTLGDVELSDAAPGALALVDQARLWLRVAA
jgi:hypothetical protein